MLQKMEAIQFVKNSVTDAAITTTIGMDLRLISSLFAHYFNPDILNE